MTQSLQPQSDDSLNKADRDLHRDKPETAVNLNQLLSVFENLNKVCEDLSSHQNEIKRKNMELRRLNKGMEK